MKFDDIVNANPATKMRKKRHGKNGMVFTAAILNEIRILSARGFKTKDFANYLGFSESGFRKAKAREPKIEEAILRGRGQGMAFVTEKLGDQIESGNMKAIEMYLKEIGGWLKEKEDKEPEKPKDVTIKIGTDDPNEAARIYQQIVKGEI